MNRKQDRKVTKLKSKFSLILGLFNQALNNPALDIWDCGDLIMYHYWYNIGLLQEIYGETAAKFKFISLEWNKVSSSRLKSP